MKLDGFRSFFEEYGSEPAFKELIRDAVGHYFPKYLSEIEKAFENNEPDVLKKTAHSLKGSASSLGLTEFAAIARRLQFYDYDNDDAVLADINELKDDYNDINALMKSLLD